MPRDNLTPWSEQDLDQLHHQAEQAALAKAEAEIRLERARRLETAPPCGVCGYQTHPPGVCLSRALNLLVDWVGEQGTAWLQGCGLDAEIAITSTEAALDGLSSIRTGFGRVKLVFIGRGPGCGWGYVATELVEIQSIMEHPWRHQDPTGRGVRALPGAVHDAMIAAVQRFAKMLRANLGPNKDASRTFMGAALGVGSDLEATGGVFHEVVTAEADKLMAEAEDSLLEDLRRTGWAGPYETAREVAARLREMPQHVQDAVRRTIIMEATRTGKATRLVEAAGLVADKPNLLELYRKL